MTLFFRTFSVKIKQKLAKNDRFSAKIGKKLSKSVKSTPDFPEKKCHLFRKIATFFENFGTPFLEKLITSAISPKKGHVPN